MWFFRPTGWPKSACQLEQLKKASVLSLARVPIIFVALADAAVVSPDGITSLNSAAGGTGDWQARFSGPAGTECGLVGDVLVVVCEEALLLEPLLISFPTLVLLFFVSLDVASADSLATFRAATSSLVSRKFLWIPSVLE